MVFILFRFKNSRIFKSLRCRSKVSSETPKRKDKKCPNFEADTNIDYQGVMKTTFAEEYAEAILMENSLLRVRTACRQTLLCRPRQCPRQRMVFRQEGSGTGDQLHRTAQAHERRMGRPAIQVGAVAAVHPLEYLRMEECRRYAPLPLCLYRDRPQERKDGIIGRSRIIYALRRRRGSTRSLLGRYGEGSGEDLLLGCGGDRQSDRP